VSVSSERLVAAIGRLSSDPEVRALLTDLGLDAQAPTIVDGVSSDIEVTQHGVALFFRTAHHLRKIASLSSLAPATSVVSDVKFSRKGYGGGPGFAEALPRGLVFSDTRSAVRERLGPPSWSSPVVKSDRWDDGDRYLTVMFARDANSIKEVACGLHWTV
jgi:hypothetical protein